MHYHDIPGEIKSLTGELYDSSKWTNERTFSAGDLRGIKALYTYNKEHHGEWHNPCSNSLCDAISCYCNSCGPLHGGVNCGWSGKPNSNGHWTCCLDD